MGRTTRRYALFVAVGGLLGACGDDLVIPPDTESGTGTSTGSTTDPPPPTSTVPTTTESPTTDDTTLTPMTTPTPTTEPTTDPTTTSPITSSTGTTTTGTDTTDTSTGTDTDTDTGNALMGRSVSQTVNGGTVASSPGFRMVFTLGQPTQNQGTTTSPGFKLQGGLIGANGNPP